MTHHNGGTSGDYCSQCGQTWQEHAYNGCLPNTEPFDSEGVDCDLNLPEEACPICSPATYDGMTEGLERLIDVLNDPYGELEVFEGIETLLRDDRARAQKMWYPVNPDRTFNR